MWTELRGGMENRQYDLQAIRMWKRHSMRQIWIAWKPEALFTFCGSKSTLCAYSAVNTHGHRRRSTCARGRNHG